MYVSHPLVWLNIQDPDLLGQVEDILRRWQIEMVEPSHEGLCCGITDIPDLDGPNVIYLWDGARRPSKMGPESSPSPFGVHHRRHWVGAQPEVDEYTLTSTLAQMKSRHFLRMPELLGDGAFVLTRYAESSSERASVLADLEEQLVQARVRDHIRQSLAQSMDELYTNAVYNAPVAEDGTPLFSSTDRRQSVISPKPIMIQFGYTPHYAAIAIRDNYGTLPIQRVVDRWRLCWDASGARFEAKDGGAGLGFFMMLERVSRMTINVREGFFTEVVLMVRRGWNRRKTMKSTPTINLCVLENAKSEDDTRQHDRYPVSWKASMQGPTGSYQAQLLDISNSGAFLALPDNHPFKTRDVIVLEIEVGDSDKALRLGATVRWLGRSVEHSRLGMGLQFHNLINAVALLSNRERTEAEARKKTKKSA